MYYIQYCGMCVCFVRSLVPNTMQQRKKVQWYPRILCMRTEDHWWGGKGALASCTPNTDTHTQTGLWKTDCRRQECNCTRHFHPIDLVIVQERIFITLQLFTVFCIVDCMWEHLHFIAVDLVLKVLECVKWTCVMDIQHKTSADMPLHDHTHI